MRLGKRNVKFAKENIVAIANGHMVSQLIALLGYVIIANLNIGEESGAMNMTH